MTKVLFHIAVSLDGFVARPRHFTARVLWTTADRSEGGPARSQLTELIAAGRRGEAVELFQTEAVGIPAAVVAQMRNAPFRPALEKVAHTLVYESTILGSLPSGLLASVRQATLVIDGEESPAVMRQAAQSLAAALPDGRYSTLKGQGHDTPSIAHIIERDQLRRGHGRGSVQLEDNDRLPARRGDNLPPLAKQ
jgi:pimeloyl-ACP methyl ester carboxylesterase